MSQKKAASQLEYRISPIGFVRKKTEYEGFLEIKKPFHKALKELDGFSHINVLWWCHLADHKEMRDVTECVQPYKKAPETVGIFATRSERRPNPIALTIVSVLNIDHKTGIIYIPFMDAENDTPIIDIKPYHPATDRVKTVTVPKWCVHWPKWYEDSAEFDWESEFVYAS
jgi:tRNA-Thr(GGU) m(6)t(6)A37 methyltransferase TsaA